MISLKVSSKRKHDKFEANDNFKAFSNFFSK